MKLKKQAHTVYKTQYHIVWVTRYRRKILTKWISAYLSILLKSINRYYPDWEYVEIGTDKDHIHIHMIIPPKYSVSFVVETIKKNTSRQLKQKFSFLEKVYRDSKWIWWKRYFVSTVWLDEETIRNYVKMQGEEESGQAELVL